LDDLHYQLLKLLEENPSITQRELSRELGVSLGKANYCLRALVDRGLIKARNFTNNRNKRAYLYILTPQGMEEKTRVAIGFLRGKIEEYERLRREIAELRFEIENYGNDQSEK
jgi:EPS-associated MarR family transcriptional regulator